MTLEVVLYADNVIVYGDTVKVVLNTLALIIHIQQRVVAKSSDDHNIDVNQTST